MFRSTPLKTRILKLLLLCAILWGGAAHALTCSVTATSIPVTTLYTAAANRDVTGSISVTCTKTGADINRPYIHIGLDQGEPPAGRNMTRQSGAQTLAYTMTRNSPTGATWTTGTGQNYGNGTAGGVLYRMNQNPATQTQTFNYYFRVAAGQNTAPAGIYDDVLITVTVRESTNAGLATGTLLQSTTFAAYTSIRDDCHFSTAPAAIAINYTSFSSTPGTGNTSFQVSCTFNTPYTLSLNTAPPPAVTTYNGTASGLNYSLVLSAGSGTGTSAPQNFGITGTIAAGQSGICPTGMCSTSQAQTIYIRF
jgi:spore coat protein U-like protein